MWSDPHYLCTLCWQFYVISCKFYLSVLFEETIEDDRWIIGNL